MKILRAQPDDADVLTAIAFAAKGHWGYPARWMESWRAELAVTPEFIASHETHAAVIDAKSIGFYALRPGNHKMDLLHLWVLPDWIGKGVGRALFQHAIQSTRTLGFRELHIESDPNAAGFYVRLGARRVGSQTRIVEQQRRELPVFIYAIGHAT